MFDNLVSGAKIPTSRDHFYCRTPEKLRISTYMVFKDDRDSVFGVDDNLVKFIDKD